MRPTDYAAAPRPSGFDAELGEDEFEIGLVAHETGREAGGVRGWPSGAISISGLRRRAR